MVDARNLLKMVLSAAFGAAPAASAFAVAGDVDPVQLETMLRQDCGACHGGALKGGLGKPLLPEALGGRSVETLASIILDGLPGTPMPPWRPLLSSDQAAWLAQRLLKGSSP